MALRQAQGPGEWGNGKMGKWENDQEKQFAECEPQKDQGGDILIEGDNTIATEISIAGDSLKVSDAQIPKRGDMRITNPRGAITAIVRSPITNTAQIFKHHKSQALEGAGKIFILGLITLVVLIALVILLLSNGVVTEVLVSLIVGLALALGTYLLLLALFFVLLFFIIKNFGA